MPWALGERSRPIYETLRARIRDGELLPGSKLPGCVTLAGEFGVAPMTLRQVLDHLEADGLISCEPGRGTFVRAMVPPAVLIVEDNAPVRRTLSRYVLRAGYRAVEASGPAEGVTALQRDPAIVLVLSDVRMPTSVAGIDFIISVRRRWPALPLAAITGYPADLAELHGTPECPILIIPKPFRATQIAELFRLTIPGALPLTAAIGG